MLVYLTLPRRRRAHKRANLCERVNPFSLFFCCPALHRNIFFFLSLCLFYWNSTPRRRSARGAKINFIKKGQGAGEEEKERWARRAAPPARLSKVDYLMGGNKGERNRKNSLHQARTGISLPVPSFIREFRKFEILNGAYWKRERGTKFFNEQHAHFLLYTSKVIF